MLVEIIALPPPSATVVLAEPRPVDHCGGGEPVPVSGDFEPFAAVFHLVVCVENSGTEHRRIELPEGTVLAVSGAADGWQRIVVSPGLAIRIDKGTAWSFSLRGLCAEPGKFSPFGQRLEPVGRLQPELLRRYQATRPNAGWLPQPAGLIVLSQQFASTPLPPPGKIELP